MKEWAGAVWDFLRRSLTPFRHLNAMVQAIAWPALGVAAFRVAQDRWGVWVAVALTLAILAALFLVEGTRREYAARTVRLTFGCSEAEDLGSGWWKLAVSVTNDGAPGRLIGRCAGVVDGVEQPTADFTLPWEGQSDPQQHVPKGWKQYMPVAYLDIEESVIRFALPWTTYAQIGRQSMGPVKRITADVVSFRLELHHLDRDVSRFAQVTINPAGPTPSIDVT